MTQRDAPIEGQNEVSGLVAFGLRAQALINLIMEAGAYGRIQECVSLRARGPHTRNTPRPRRDIYSPHKPPACAPHAAPLPPHLCKGRVHLQQRLPSHRLPAA